MSAAVVGLQKLHCKITLLEAELQRARVAIRERESLRIELAQMSKDYGTLAGISARVVMEGLEGEVIRFPGSLAELRVELIRLNFMVAK